MRLVKHECHPDRMPYDPHYRYAVQPQDADGSEYAASFHKTRKDALKDARETFAEGVYHVVYVFEACGYEIRTEWDFVAQFGGE